MGTSELAGTEFRETLRRLRKNRGWSQAYMAELLSAKGLTCYPTTIAKIEAGDRAIQVDELVAVADIFEVSLDTLLARNTGQTKDKAYLVSTLDDEATRAGVTISSIGSGLRRAVTSLDGFKLTRDEKTLRDGCAAACDAMDSAIQAIYETQSASARIAGF
jgi:transcriptional regulator with XRE-family HTH domain